MIGLKVCTLAVIVLAASALTNHHHMQSQSPPLANQSLLAALNIDGSLCNGTTYDDRQEIQTKLSQAIEANNQIILLAKLSGNQTQVAKYTAKYESDNKDLRSLIDKISKQCPEDVNVNSYLNVAVDNWIAGSNFKTDAVTKTYLLNSGSKGMRACPLTKPFIYEGSTTCFSCDDPTPIYDISAKKCVTCPIGQQLVNHTCVCPDNLHWDQTSKTCIV